MSMLSGWLNTDAPCRGPNGGHMVRGEVQSGSGGRWWATAVHAVCRGGLVCRFGVGGERT
eukprot:scaffold46078_cov34-Phaeocystis_antarctica.AAC.2